MNYSKPTLIVITGPPGAGKSTHGKTILPDEFEGITPFDRDKTMLSFEEQLKGSNEDPDELTYKAFTHMESQLIDEMATAIANKAHYALETPLHYSEYWNDYIEPFIANNYQIELSYICLDRLSDCIARVQHRSRTGGHDLPPSIIREVYEESPLLINRKSHLLSALNLYDGTGVPKLLASLENNQLIYLRQEAKKKKWIMEGLPQISKKIRQVLPPIKQQKGMRF
jgi:predicted ABC-type ATPase